MKTSAARVRDLMSRPVFTCRTTDTADRAAQIMWDHDCGSVPVVDERNRLTGMVTDRDLCMAALFHGVPLSSIPLSRVMSTDVATCRPDDELSAVERLMGARQVRRIPIVDEEGAPIGIVSVGDLARPLLRPAAAPRKAAPAANGLVQTIAAISQPHGHQPDSDTRAEARL
jgi:CBS domain-containing protein